MLVLPCRYSSADLGIRIAIYCNAFDLSQPCARIAERQQIIIVTGRIGLLGDRRQRSRRSYAAVAARVAAIRAARRSSAFLDCRSRIPKILVLLDFQCQSITIRRGEHDFDRIVSILHTHRNIDDVIFRVDQVVIAVQLRKIGHCGISRAADRNVGNRLDPFISVRKGEGTVIRAIRTFLRDRRGASVGAAMLVIPRIDRRCRPSAWSRRPWRSRSRPR